MSHEISPELRKKAVALGMLKPVAKDAATEDSGGPGTLLSEVAAETVSWLWQGYIPLGKLTVLDGDPGLGKSCLSLDLAARLSRPSHMPDGSEAGVAAGVVLISAEDGLADTVRPRLDVAEGDCSKIVALTSALDAESGEERPLMLPDDCDAIAKAIDRVSAKLVVIDPLMAFLNGNTNSHRDQDIRRVLFQVSKLAEDTGAAILVVRHLNKAPGGNPLYRGGGSIGIIGAARSGLLVAKDPDNEDGRVLAPMKSNLCKAPESLSFHLEDADGVPRVVWDGISSHSAGSLLAAPVSDEEGAALAEAKEVLSDILSDGPVPAKKAIRQAQDAGVAKRTLERAKESLGVCSRRSGFGGTGGWCWELPKTANPLTLGGLGDLWENDPQNEGISAGQSKDRQGNHIERQDSLLNPQVDAKDRQDRQEKWNGKL